MTRDKARDLLARFGLPGAAVVVLAGLTVAALAGPDDAAREPVRAAGSTTPTPAVTSFSPTPTPTPSPTPAGTVAPRTSAPATPPPASWPPCGRNDRAISGTVVDTTGHPLRGMTVNGFACPPARGQTVDVTDAQGRFSFPCSMGSDWVTVGPFEWYTGTRSSDADVGFAWLGGVVGKRVPCGSKHDVVLRPAATVEAQLVDETGATVTDPRSERFVLNAIGPGGWEDFAALLPDAQGRLSFTGLAPGTYAIVGDPDEEVVEFEVAAGETKHVDMRVARRSSPSPTSAPTVVPTATAT